MGARTRERRQRPLLDQVSSQQLGRLAASGYEPRPFEEPAVRPRVGLKRLTPLAALVLPTGMLALGMVMLVGLARGVAGDLANDGGFSLADAVMVVLLVIAGATVLGQSLQLLARHPRGRTLASRLRSLLPRRERPPIAEPPPWARFFDQVDEVTLMQLSHIELGNRLAVTGRSVRRRLDTLLWVVLGAVSVAVAAIAAVGAGFSIWRATRGGAVSPLLLVLGLVCALAFVGLVAMTRTAVLAIFDAGRRRRRPAFVRLFRAAARSVTAHPEDGRAGDTRTAAVTAVAVVVLVALAFWPEFTQGFGGSEEPDGGAAAIEAPSATALAAASTPTPPASIGAVAPSAAAATVEPTPAPPSIAISPPPASSSPPAAILTVSPTAPSEPPTATATAQPALTVTPTPTPTPMPAPSPTPSPTPTASLTPSATPTASPTPTPTPTPPSSTPTASPTPTSTLTPKPTPTPTPTGEPEGGKP